MSILHGQRASDKVASNRPRSSMRGEAALSGAPATDDPGEWRPAIVYQERLCLPPSKRANMSKINKLSVEKALNKLRANDAK